MTSVTAIPTQNFHRQVLVQETLSISWDRILKISLVVLPILACCICTILFPALHPLPAILSGIYLFQIDSASETSDPSISQGTRSVMAFVRGAMLGLAVGGGFGLIHLFAPLPSL